MSDRQHVREVLAHRARVLAASSSSGAPSVPQEAEEHLVLTIGGQRIGIRLASVQEVIPATGLAPVPRAPRWLRGVAHVRGTLVSVVDLARWWKLDSEGTGKYLVVLLGRSGAIAIVSDADLEIRTVDRHELVSGDECLKSHEGLTAVTRDLVFLLDVDHLIDHPDIVIGAGASPPGGAAKGAGHG